MSQNTAVSQLEGQEQPQMESETASGSESEKKEQLHMEAEKKMKADLKEEMKATLETLMDEKLRSVQTHLKAPDFSGLERQIGELTCRLSSQVSEETGKTFIPLDSMQVAIRNELQQQNDALKKELTKLWPMLEISDLVNKLDQLANSEKKMKEDLTEEMKATLETLLDEKLRSVQAQLKAPDFSSLDKQIRELTCRLSSQVSEETEKTFIPLDSMQFAIRNELQQHNDALKKELRKSWPMPEISDLVNKLDQREKSELEKLQAELDWRRARNNADDITLRADTAHPNLSISKDKKTLIHEAQYQKVPEDPERFDSTVCVLGSENFSSGKHYWEVEVVSSSEWDLGVARKNTKRKGKISLLPKEGFWVMGLSGRDYWAKTDPWTKIKVQQKPRKIGVYLSCEDGVVTFYNVTDMSVLFTFNNCSFSGEVYPFFKNSHKETTMRICSIKEV